MSPLANAATPGENQKSRQWEDTGMEPRGIPVRVKAFEEYLP